MPPTVPGREAHENTATVAGEQRLNGRHLHPASNHAEEMTSTRKSPLRAKNIRVQPSANEIVNEDALATRQNCKIENTNEQENGRPAHEVRVLKSEVLAASRRKKRAKSPDPKECAVAESADLKEGAVAESPDTKTTCKRRKTWVPGTSIETKHDSSSDRSNAAADHADSADVAASEIAKSCPAQSDLKRELQERDARIAELEKEASSAHQGLEMMNSVKADMAAELDSLRSRLQVALEACSQKESDLRQATSQRGQLAAEVELLRKESARARELEAREHETAKTNARLEHDIEDLRGNIQNLSGRLADTEGKLAAEAELSRKESWRVKELEELERQTAESKARLERYIEDLQDNIQNLSGRLTDAEWKLAAEAESSRNETWRANELEVCQRRTAESKASLERDIENLNRNNQKLLECLAEAEWKLAAEAESSRKESERARELEELYRETAESSMKESGRARELEERYRETAETKACLERDNEELRGNISSLDQRLVDTELERTLATKRREEEVAQAEERLLKQAQQIALLESTIENLRHQMEGGEEVLRAFQRDVKNKAEEICEQDRQNSALKSTIEGLSRQVEAREEAFGVFRREAEKEAEEKFSEQARQNSYLESTISNMKLTIEQLHRQLAAATEAYLAFQQLHEGNAEDKHLRLTQISVLESIIEDLRLQVEAERGTFGDFRQQAVKRAEENLTERLKRAFVLESTIEGIRDKIGVTAEAFYAFRSYALEEKELLALLMETASEMNYELCSANEEITDDPSQDRLETLFNDVQLQLRIKLVVITSNRRSAFTEAECAAREYNQAIIERDGIITEKKHEGHQIDIDNLERQLSTFKLT